MFKKIILAAAAILATSGIAQADTAAINIFKSAPSYVQEAFYGDRCTVRTEDELDRLYQLSPEERNAVLLPGLRSLSKQARWIYFDVANAHEKEVPISVDLPEGEYEKRSAEYCHAAKRVMK